MKAVIWMSSFLLIAYVTPAWAPTVTSAELCAQGDRTACREAELEKQIDFHIFAEGADYKLASGPRTQWLRLDAAADPQSRMKIKAAACTYYNEVWLGPVIEEYERLRDVRAIDRAGYERCMELLK